MTWRKREIMEMAREAGMVYREFEDEFANANTDGVDLKTLEAFAELVRADERNRTWTQEHWTDYERSIAAAEREACANICETLELPEWPDKVRQPLAQAIRARGEQA